MTIETDKSIGDLLEDALKALQNDQPKNTIKEPQPLLMPKQIEGVDPETLSAGFRKEVKRLRINELDHDILEKLASVKGVVLGTDKEVGHIVVTDPERLNGQEPYAYQRWGYYRKDSDKLPIRHRFASIFLKTTPSGTEFSLEIGPETFSEEEYLAIERRDLTMKIARSYLNPPTPEENREHYFANRQKEPSRLSLSNR